MPMLPPVGGNNFGIILPNCMVGFGKHVPAAKLGFSVVERMGRALQWMNTRRQTY